MIQASPEHSIPLVTAVGSGIAVYFSPGQVTIPGTSAETPGRSLLSLLELPSWRSVSLALLAAISPSSGKSLTLCVGKQNAELEKDTQCPVDTVKAPGPSHARFMFIMNEVNISYVLPFL